MKSQDSIIANLNVTVNIFNKFINLRIQAGQLSYYE